MSFRCIIKWQMPASLTNYDTKMYTKGNNLTNVAVCLHLWRCLFVLTVHAHSYRYTHVYTAIRVPTQNFKYRGGPFYISLQKSVFLVSLFKCALSSSL